jgi:hypothetical protein
VGSSAPRWLHGTTRIIYPRLVKTDQVEIASYDTATGQSTVFTDDGGRKDEVSGFFAPEYGGEVLYAAQLDNREICVLSARLQNLRRPTPRGAECGERG